LCPVTLALRSRAEHVRVAERFPVRIGAKGTSNTLPAGSELVVVGEGFVVAEVTGAGKVPLVAAACARGAGGRGVFSWAVVVVVLRRADARTRPPIRTTAAHAVTRPGIFPTVDPDRRKQSLQRSRRRPPFR
jgi:hypothetical protein